MKIHETIYREAVEKNGLKCDFSKEKSPLFVAAKLNDILAYRGPYKMTMLVGAGTNIKFAMEENRLTAGFYTEIGEGLHRIVICEHLNYAQITSRKGLFLFLCLIAHKAEAVNSQLKRKAL